MTRTEQEKNKIQSIVLIIALCMGATGLGLGAYSVVGILTGSFDGADGTDGVDATLNPNIYYCSSATELQSALTNIGTGSGLIIITQSITLTTPILLNGGGNYIIEGAGLVTVDINGDWSAFVISDVAYCAIRDLRIDAADVTTGDRRIIDVSETNDNRVDIENINFLGGLTYAGYGIYIASDNVWITNCYFYQLSFAIFQMISSSFAHISGNTVIEMLNRVQMLGDYSTFDNNLITDSLTGNELYLGGDYNVISNNIFRNGSESVIRVHHGDFNNLVGNIIIGITENDATNRSGIIVNGDADNNTIVSNLVMDFLNTGAGEGRGIDIDEAACNYNSIIANTCTNNDVNIRNVGTDTYINSTYAP